MSQSKQNLQEDLAISGKMAKAAYNALEDKQGEEIRYWIFMKSLCWLITS